MTASTRGKGRILFLSQWFPFPADNGSKLRIRSLLAGLAQQYEVVLVSLNDRRAGQPDLSEALSICREVHIVPFESYNPRSFKAMLGYLSLAPRSIQDTYSDAMAQLIRQVVTVWRPDVVIASQLGTAIYYPFFARTHAVFEEVETSLQYERYAAASTTAQAIRHGLTWWKHKRFLARTLKHFQKSTVVSDQERDLLAKIAPRGPEIQVIPNCVNLSDYQNIHEPLQANTLIFTGSFRYDPNYEAMVWFLSKVYPEIKARVPGARLIITGDHADRPLPPAADVAHVGFVHDVRPLIAASTVSVAPLRSGGGTRLKLLEAMALRTPVVTTPKGAEGLRVAHEAQVLIGDSPDEFARGVVKLLTEPKARQSLAESAFQLVQNTYDWSKVMPGFIELVDTLIASQNVSRRRLSLA